MGVGMVHVVRDRDLRAALVTALRERTGGDQLVVPEVDILGPIPARIDVLQVADRIHAYEIKSDVDDLRRLPRQMAAYEQVVERASLVVGTRYSEHALNVVPEWWSIEVASVNQHSVLQLRTLRRGKLNPNVDPQAVAAFLPHQALAAILRAHGLERASRRSVDELRFLFALQFSRRTALQTARDAMRAREDWHTRAHRLDQLLADFYAVPGSGGEPGRESCLSTTAR